MSLQASELSTGVFVRGLSNLKAQLTKAEAHAASTGSGEASLLNAQLAAEGRGSGSPADLHGFTLAAQVHWAAEGARLAIVQLLGAPRVPAASEEKSFAALHQHLDATIAYLREVAPSELEGGLDREIVVETRRGATRSNGRQFLSAFALPHFFYHLTAAYSILRNQGVPLTMGDFLGNWGAS